MTLMIKPDINPKCINIEVNSLQYWPSFIYSGYMAPWAAIYLSLIHIYSISICT